MSDHQPWHSPYGPYPSPTYGTGPEPYGQAAPAYGVQPGPYGSPSGPYVPQGPTDPEPEKRTNGFGIAALIIGIIALIGAFIPYINFVSGFLAVVGIVLSIVGLCIKNLKRGISIAGGIVSLVAMCLSIIMAIVYTASVISGLNVLTEHTSEPNQTTWPEEGAGTRGSIENPVALGTPFDLPYDGVPRWALQIDLVQIESDGTNDSGQDDTKFTSAGVTPSATSTPTPSATSTPTATSTPSPGETDATSAQRYIAINVSVTYLGEDSGVPSQDIEIAFIDGQDTVFTPTYGAADAPTAPDTRFEEIGHTATGETQTGSVIILVQEDTMYGGLARATIDGEHYYFNVV